jgi:tetratricopeptide (TPR) repeat protein
MGRQLDADLDEATALEVAQRTGAAGAVLPSLTRVGSGMLLSASVVASDGAMLAIVRRPVANDDALTGALDTLSLDLRKELGESRRSLRESPSLLYLLTPSLEAARLFSEARQITVTEPTLAASLLEQAISIDPEFAWAYDYLSTLRQNTGGEYLSPLERELELADRLLPHQRRLAEIQGLSVRKGDYQAAIEVAREGLQASTPMMLANPDYPHTYYTYLVLSYMEVGDPAQAREIYSELTEKVAAGEAEEWELEFLTRIINSAMLAAQMGDSTRADLYMAQWNERVPEIYRWLGESWTAIAGKQWSRAAAAARRVTTADASPEHRMQGALLLGSVEAVRGRPRSSREAFALAGGIALERGDPFYALSVEIQEADAEFFALADPQRASARLVDFLGEPPPENGLARRYHARAQAVAFAMCAYFVEPPVEGPASRLNCRADVVTDSLRDPIETLEALGWKAVVEGRYGDAVRIGSEPLLRRAGGAGSRGRAPAAFAYEALGTPDSAAAIFRDMARAPFGYISSAPSAIVMRSYALRQLARLPGAAGDSALAVLRAEWAEAEPEFLGRVADSPP